MIGFVGLVAAVALSLWAFMQLREAPLHYNGANASLDLEFRIRHADVPASASGNWLNVEVQTAKTQTEGTASWDSRRVEGEYTSYRSSRGHSIDRDVA